jgi:hypothetical protein
MPDYTNIVDNYTKWATERMAVYANAYKASLAKIAGGQYGAHDLTNDLAAAWVRMTEDVATLMTRAATAGQGPAADAPPDEGAEGNQ